MTDQMKEIFGEVIYTYTRAQAIADGVLIDLSVLAPDVCRQHFKHPIACTSEVWQIIERAVSNKRTCNDLPGVVHDVLYMSKNNILEKISESGVLFQVIISGAGRQKVFTFKMLCGPGDSMEPVLTLMLPEQD